LRASPASSGSCLDTERRSLRGSISKEAFA